jgi:hypothetical protein
MSLGGQWYTTNALGSSSRTAPLALPAPSEADELYKDWQVFSRWLKSEDDRIAQEAGLTRPLSLGDTPAAAPSGDAQTAAVLYHLRRELEDAIIIEENRAKRTAVEKRTHLGPSDAVRRELRNLPPVPQRTYTLDTDFSGNFSRFEAHSSLTDSMATIRPGDTTPSPTTSPTQLPQTDHSYFGEIQTSLSPAPVSPSISSGRMSSVSTQGSRLSTSPESRLSVSLGQTTAGTTPEYIPSHVLRTKFSETSLRTLSLGEGALDWNRLCRKVQVERTVPVGPPEVRECDIHWRYNEDAGLSIRSVYRSGNTVKVWTTQSFPATGPSIPLTTSYPDGDISIDFPRSSFGRLDKRCTDIKYTFTGQEASHKMQNLLYTNNGKDPAELLFDRCVLTISSNLNKPEGRGKNIRLWKKSEQHEGEFVDVLVLLFYTSALPEDRAHWVEEPHYAFQWLTEETCKKSSDKLTLIFSKEPGKWSKDKLFQRRKSSSASTRTATIGTATPRRDSGQSVRSPPPSPGIPSLVRSGTHNSAVSTTSLSSYRSLVGTSVKGRIASLNRFGYDELEIKFLNKADRKDFVTVWKQHVGQLGNPMFT